jgi:hypothetical protein
VPTLNRRKSTCRESGRREKSRAQVDCDTRNACNPEARERPAKLGSPLGSRRGRSPIEEALDVTSPLSSRTYLPRKKCPGLAQGSSIRWPTGRRAIRISAEGRQRIPPRSEWRSVPRGSEPPLSHPASLSLVDVFALPVSPRRPGERKRARDPR